MVLCIFLPALVGSRLNATWKRYIDDVFSLWDTNREEIDQFILEANRHHPTIKFAAEISEEKTNFLDTAIFKGERFYQVIAAEIP